MNFSVVIPIYKRNEIFKSCLISINNQLLKPIEIIVIDNNTSKYESKYLRDIIASSNISSEINIKILKSPKNSGAIARNIGVKNAKTNLIAFLDSDVILDENYYSTLINYFKKNKNLIAIQGVDKSLIEAQNNFSNKHFIFKLFNSFEQFFETSSLYSRDSAYVSPSLAVAHPNVKSEFEISSQWISTCAGIFKKSLFDKYCFPNQFITYSNNEYLFLSYKLFKNDEGQMIYTSKAKYRDVQTKEGRLNVIPLIFQIEVNDYFIFIRLFDINIKNLFIFAKSRIGHLIFNLLSLISRKRFSINNFMLVIFSFFYPLLNIKSIINGDLTFYERRFYKY